MSDTTTRAQERRIWGEGWTWPLRPSPAGQLARSQGGARLDESITAILETPIGTRPLDPSYGVPIEVYDPVTDVLALAWAIGAAIERCEPRIERVVVEVLGIRPQDASVLLRILYTPRGALTPLTRTYPFFRLATS